MIKIILLVIILTLFMPSDVYAWCGCIDKAPLKLDQQQADKWVNSLPTARPYLARMWGISQQEAEAYGAKYRTPACSSGIGADQPLFRSSGNTTPYADNPLSPNPYIGSSGNLIDTKSDWTMKYMDTFEQIKIDYHVENTNTPIKIAYSAPPSLDYTQQVRWGTALPSARAYLARIWNISVEEAIKYGAGY